MLEAFWGCLGLDTRGKEPQVPLEGSEAGSQEVASEEDFHLKEEVDLDFLLGEYKADKSIILSYKILVNGW